MVKKRYLSYLFIELYEALRKVLLICTANGLIPAPLA